MSVVTSDAIIMLNNRVFGVYQTRIKHYNIRRLLFFSRRFQANAEKDDTICSDEISYIFNYCNVHTNMSAK